MAKAEAEWFFWTTRYGPLHLCFGGLWGQRKGKRASLREKVLQPFFNLPLESLMPSHFAETEAWKTLKVLLGTNTKHNTKCQNLILKTPTERHDGSSCGRLDQLQGEPNCSWLHISCVAKCSSLPAFPRRHRPPAVQCAALGHHTCCPIQSIPASCKETCWISQKCTVQRDP